MKKVLATLALLTSASAAHAGFVVSDSALPAGQTMNVVDYNDFHDILSGLGVTTYTLGASLGVNTAGSVTYYYYGKEAGFSNQFFAGDLSYTTGLTPSVQNYFADPYEIGTVSVGAGLLDFSFCALDYSLVNIGCLSNQQNDLVGLNAVQSIAMNVSDSTAWLFWDDSGAGPDDNHDDMIIKAVFRPATSVPEPNTLALLGIGLLAVGFSVRKQAAQIG